MSKETIFGGEMSCDRGARQGSLALGRAGVTTSQVLAVWGSARRARADDNKACYALTLIEQRTALCAAGAICPHCGALKNQGENCVTCLDTGWIEREAMPVNARWMAGGARQVTLDDLALAFESSGMEGRLEIARIFPGIVRKLSDRGRQRLIEEARSHPRLALLGRLPDILAEAGGREVLVEIASRHPTLAQRSLRAAAILRTSNAQ